MARLARGGAALLVAAVLVATPGCAQAGGGVHAPGPARSVIDGEVRSVDVRSGRIQVRDDRGRTRTLRYDRDTRVLYRQRRYRTTALERGDLVRVWVTHDRRGRPWADRVEVRASVADRRGTPARVVRVDGTVGQVDARRGYFTVRRARSAPVVVYVPARLGRDDVRRLERLRAGSRVRAEVRPLGAYEAELVRFR